MPKHGNKKSNSPRKVRSYSLTDGMDADERESLLMVLAALVLISIVGMLAGIMWFATYPEAMNQPFVPSTWYMPVLVGLFAVGLILMISLAYNKKDMVSWRVFGIAFSFLLMTALYVWWYQVIPFLY